jgi:hypothetical protein
MTAVKLYIKHIIEGMYDGSHLDTIFGTVSEVRIFGTLVDTFVTDDETYTSLTVDDGTETIRIKGWRRDVERLKQFNIGDIVDIVGKIREYNDEIYLSPQIISKITPNRWILRELELMKLYTQAGVSLPQDTSPLPAPAQKDQMAPQAAPEKSASHTPSQSREPAEIDETSPEASVPHGEESPPVPPMAKQSKSSKKEKESFEEIEEFDILEGDEVVETVLDLLKDEMTKEDLIEKSGLDEIDVELALRELLDEGQLVKEGERYKRKSP